MLHVIFLLENSSVHQNLLEFCIKIYNCLLFDKDQDLSSVLTSCDAPCDFLQENSKLHLNLLELEVSGDPRANGPGVQQCISRALEAPLSPRTKILFSQRGLQFAEDFGTTIQR